MKQFKITHHEILMEESAYSDNKLMSAYQKLFDELLDFRSISGSRIFEAINVSNTSITSKPMITESLLRQNNLPDFVFLASLN